MAAEALKRIARTASLLVAGVIGACGAPASSAHSEERNAAPTDERLAASEASRQSLGVEQWQVTKDEDQLIARGFDAQGEVRSEFVVDFDTLADGTRITIVQSTIQGPAMMAVIVSNETMSVDRNTFRSEPDAARALERALADLGAGVLAPSTPQVASSTTNTLQPLVPRLVNYETPELYCTKETFAGKQLSCAVQLRTTFASCAQAALVCTGRTVLSDYTNDWVDDCNAATFSECNRRQDVDNTECERCSAPCERACDDRPDHESKVSCLVGCANP